MGGLHQLAIAAMSGAEAVGQAAQQPGVIGQGTEAVKNIFHRYVWLLMWVRGALRPPAMGFPTPKQVTCKPGRRTATWLREHR